MSTNAAPLAPWRLAFLLLTRDEQTERLRLLHRHGWQEAALIGLSGWSLADVRRVLAEHGGVVEIESRADR